MEELLNLHVIGVGLQVRWGAMTVPVSDQPETYERVNIWRQ